jgi:membrane protease YdiL (CAAX protease family)
VIDPRRIRLRCYLVIFLLPPFLAAVAAAVDLLSGGAGFSLEALWAYADRPLSLLPALLFLLFFGPVPEEVAWRGYALDRLRGGWGPAGSALIIGGVWMVWHLPLFFIPGTYQHGLGVGTYPFWLFNLALIPQSIVMVWLVEQNRRSILAAILLHFVVNATGELSDLSATAEGLYVLLWWGLAITMYRDWLRLCDEEESPTSGGIAAP